MLLCLSLSVSLPDFSSLAMTDGTRYSMTASFDDGLTQTGRTLTFQQSADWLRGMYDAEFQ